MAHQDHGARSPHTHPLRRSPRRDRGDDADALTPRQWPEQQVSDPELTEELEIAIDTPPDFYRSAFMLQDVEGLSTAETAACLELSEQTAKTRLHRARALVRNHLFARARAALPDRFRFAGTRCDALVGAVLTRISSGTLDVQQD